MNYYIVVSDENRVLEKLHFDDRTRALYFAERRRKQGYIVTVTAYEAGVSIRDYMKQEGENYGTY